MNHRKFHQISALRATLTAVWTIGMASLAHGNGAGILQRNYFGPSKISSNQETPKEVRKATAYVEPKSKSAQQNRTAAKPKVTQTANQIETAKSKKADSSDVKPPKETTTQTSAVELARAIRVEKATMAPVVPEAPIVPEPPAPVVAKSPDLEVPPLINPTAPESRPADAAGNFHADAPASTQPPVPPMPSVESVASVADPLEGKTTEPQPAPTPATEAAETVTQAKKAYLPTDKGIDEFVSWRERYELGPGDILTFSFAGRPELLREAVKISPEGTVSYLQAIQIRASGRTVDELRDAINDALSDYHKDPRAIITPISVQSKRYTIMGQVRNSGSYPLDRPMNLLEAISKSAGIKVGVADSTMVELADLDRSFLVRGRDKLQVDFSKLYLEGDLSQNVSLEPNDYIYIASNLRNQYYLIGALKRQGSQPLTSELTVAGAIASATGFHDKAWRSRVLLVRGSLTNPETQVVNVSDILHGRAKDIKIQPKDIIYVHYRPWAFAEDIIDNAIKEFLGAVSAAAVDSAYGNDDDD